jgi:aminoglycoside phosphotransferase (APT) family kinase protein
VVVRVGRRLVVEHVQGAVLDGRLREATLADRRRLVRATGRLLARLHGRNHAGAPVSAYQRAVSLVTGRLVRRRQMSRADAARLAALSRPAQARAALTHGDPAPENLVLTASGRLRAIDEERVAVRPVAYDLARAICRWPLDAGEEAALLAAYAAAGGQAREFQLHRRFWIASALATSALYRMRYRPGALGPIVAQLRALAAESSATERARTPPPRR